jgi:hypothetical protein
MLGRRPFLGLSLAILLEVLPRWVRAAVVVPRTAPPPPPQPFAALTPFLDTLIPEDETPAASAFGIADSVLADARRIDAYLRLVGAGCQWLDVEARRRGATDFAALAPVRREEVAAEAEKAPPRSVPRVFFDRMRGAAMGHYYARPETWPGLGYSGPPQPEGFLDFDRPPAARRT